MIPTAGRADLFVEEKCSEHLKDSQILVSCTKGILNASLETVDEILHRILPTSFHSRLAYLSGPSFAREVANKSPTAVTIAASVCLKRSTSCLSGV